MLFSDEELQKPVSLSIEKVRPMLLKDGGNIEVVKIEGGRVFVRLQGACANCSAKNTTLKNAIESTLKIDIHPDIQVVEV